MIRMIFMSCLFFLCTAFAYREPIYCKIVDRITKEYFKECAKPRRLMFSGYGGAMMDDIQSVTLRFLSFDALSVDQARILYVEMMEEYLKKINCHEKVRPYLHHFPFEDSRRRITQDGHVALMSIAKDHVL